MSRLLSGVENGRARIRRMGRLTSRISLAWRRSRGGRSLIDLSVLMVLLVSLSSLRVLAWLLFRQGQSRPRCLSLDPPMRGW